ncbi:MAG: formate/nitrite transporter family protein [Candidatus Competibacterales bacterium]|nr:formate/nitrite transporter family protein [Candidatus Competibacterales bacterium]
MPPDSDNESRLFGLVDAILPKDMAKRAERAGAEKAGQDGLSLLALAALAGAYIAFGATFAATVTAGFGGDVPVGLGKMLGGVAFSLAYVLAIVGGAELFTTNNLMVMAWAHGRLSTRGLLRAWGIVFVGNFAGAVATGVMLIIAGQHQEAGGAVGAALLDSAARIQGLSLVEALFLGILGNTLLCLGVWLTYSGRSTTDRILALTPPVAAFYALGLEHAIAVMFYLPCAAVIGLLAEPGFWAAIEVQPLAVSAGGLLRVLLPVTLGNVIGGGFLVALVYWFVYLRPGRV